MKNLSPSQKWVLVAFVASGLIIANTLFLKGDVQTFGYVIISLVVAAFAVISGGDDEKKQES